LSQVPGMSPRLMASLRIMLDRSQDGCNRLTKRWQGHPLPYQLRYRRVFARSVRAHAAGRKQKRCSNRSPERANAGHICPSWSEAHGHCNVSRRRRMAPSEQMRLSSKVNKRVRIRQLCSVKANQASGRVSSLRVERQSPGRADVFMCDEGSECKCRGTLLFGKRSEGAAA